MALFEFRGKKPTIGKNCYIADSAEVIGNVAIGDGCYVGPGAKIRGDYGIITVGDKTAVEENAVIHARPNERTKIGNDVTIGHAAIIHNASIDDFAIIGMGSIVSDYSSIGRWAVVAEGAVVKNGDKIPPQSIAAGIPAIVKGTINDEYKSKWLHFKSIYVDLAKTYRDDLKKLKDITPS